MLPCKGINVTEAHTTANNNLDFERGTNMNKQKWVKSSLTAVLGATLVFGAAACGNAENNNVVVEDENVVTPDTTTPTPDTTTPDAGTTTPDAGTTEPGTDATAPDVNVTTPDVDVDTPDVDIDSPEGEGITEEGTSQDTTTTP
ncbi:hypothetical protein PATA110616_06590 [Paenibacillus tarimensis]